MYPFLILSSLSVGFYLVLLVALHRDAKRHRKHVTGAQLMHGGRPSIRLVRNNARVVAGGRGPELSGDVTWHPVTTMQLRPAGRTVQVLQSKPVIAATPVNSVSQAKCG